MRVKAIPARPLALPVFLLGALVFTSLQAAEPVSIRIGGGASGEPLYSFWHVANFAFRRDRTFSAARDNEVRLEKSPFSTEVMVDYALGGRFPGSEEYYFGQNPDGSLRVDFSGLLTRIRNVREAGLKPWIGLENVPPLMSDPVEWNTYGNSAPPADYDLFHAYTRLAMEAIVEEFGQDAVSSWNFIIATEPDLDPGHWTGGKEAFMRLLDHTLAAALEVAPEIPISPGNILNPWGYKMERDSAETDSLEFSRQKWGLDIIDHMAAGNINPTGQPGSKMDFFCYSWYARVGRPIGLFDKAFAITRERLARYPQYRDLPVDVREFGILSDEQRNRLYAGDASEYGASFYAAIARRVYDYRIRYVFEWDHATMGLLHPRGQVISMLRRMEGGRRLPVEVQQPDGDTECGAIACRKDGDIFILLYHHNDQRRGDGPRDLHLLVEDRMLMDKKRWVLEEWSVDHDHATWIHALLADARDAGIEPLAKAGKFEGSPNRLFGPGGEEFFAAHLDRYRKLAQLPRTGKESIGVHAAGRINLDLTLPAHSVRLLRLSPARPVIRPGNRPHRPGWRR